MSTILFWAFWSIQIGFVAYLIFGTIYYAIAGIIGAAGDSLRGR